MLSLKSWNVAENYRWYVRLAAGNVGVTVEMYLTQANANARTNRRAYGESSGFGDDIPVLMHGDNGQSITEFQSTGWHIVVSGLETDTTATVTRVNPFVDLPEVNSDVYLNPDLSLARGSYEIALHTNNQRIFSVSLATHLPTVSAGAIASLAVSDRSISAVGQIIRRSIRIDKDSMTEDLDIVAFEGVHR